MLIEAPRRETTQRKYTGGFELGYRNKVKMNLKFINLKQINNKHKQNKATSAVVQHANPHADLQLLVRLQAQEKADPVYAVRNRVRNEDLPLN